MVHSYILVFCSVRLSLQVYTYRLLIWFDQWDKEELNTPIALTKLHIKSCLLGKMYGTEETTLCVLVFLISILIL